MVPARPMDETQLRGKGMPASIVEQRNTPSPDAGQVLGRCWAGAGQALAARGAGRVGCDSAPRCMRGGVGEVDGWVRRRGDA